MFSSLKSKLLALCLGSIVVAMFGQVVANYATTKNNSDAAIELQLTGATRSASANVAAWVREKTLIVKSMQAAVDLPDTIAVLKIGAQVGGFERAFIGYPDKRYISTDANTPADYDPTTRPWYVQAVKDGAPGITTPYKSATSGHFVLTVVAPLGRAGSPTAVVGANITLERLGADVAAIKPTEHSFAFLVGAAGEIMAHADSKLVLSPATTVAPALTAEKLRALAESRVTLEETVNGRELFMRVSKIEGTSWFVVVALDKADATAGVVSSLKTSSIAALIAVSLAVLVLFILLSKVLARLNDVRDAMRDVASGDGDLTIRIGDQGADELAQIARAYNQFAEKLTVVLRGIRSSSESVRVGAEEIAVGNMDLSSRTEQQAGALEETASAMDELTATVLQNADNSRQANQMAIAACAVAQSGGAAVAKVVATMDTITASAKQIADITGVIDNIAFQTNILSLNAAVEAARAGEQGRGFAVVASEVRNLAQRSAAAAKEIRTLITDSAKQVAKGNELAYEAGATMGDVVSSIKQVTDIMAEISAASQEQSSGIALVNKAITEMDAVTQQNAALVEEAAAAADSLQQQSNELAEAVGAFKLDK